MLPSHISVYTLLQEHKLVSLKVYYMALFSP